MSYVPTPTVDDLSILCPDLRDFIASFPKTIETATSARTAMKAMRSIPPPRPYDNPNLDRLDLQISSPNASLDQPPVTVRIWKPKSGGEKEPLPCVLWMHHGGLFSAGPRRLDNFCGRLAIEAHVIVVCPAVRQTPEYQFPAPLEDAYETFRWLATSSESSGLGIDQTRIALAGSSIGGTMAAGISLRLRDEGNTDALKLLILDDAAVTNIRSTYSSMFNPINRIWNANLTSYMWQLYLPADALTPKAQEYAVPGRAKTLAGIAPRTMILCAEWDDLRDDLIIFGTRLLQAGVPTEIHTYRGTFHVSDKLIPNAKASIQKLADVVEALRAAFSLKRL